MSYVCRECGYKGKKRSSQGHCPACDSANYRRLDSGPSDSENAGSPPWKLVMVVGLWAWLIFEIHNKLNA